MADTDAGFGDAEIDRLAHALADLTGEIVADALRKALEQRLRLEQLRRGERDNFVRVIREIGMHCASLPDIDPRTPDEIVGYDDIGMWT